VSKDIQDISDRHIEAVVGDKSNASALITINASYGSIKIK